MGILGPTSPPLSVRVARQRPSVMARGSRTYQIDIWKGRRVEGSKGRRVEGSKGRRVEEILHEFDLHACALDDQEPAEIADDTVILCASSSGKSRCVVRHDDRAAGQG